MRAAGGSSRRFFEITMILMIEWTTRGCRGAPAPDKLLPGQRAPFHALSSSAHSLRLAPPLTRALTPANVGQLKPSKGGSPPAPKPAAASGPAAAPQEDGVTREEMTSLKEVDGQPVFVVVGSYAYESPDGLPVSFKYMADENGNKASFTIGAAAGGGGGGAGSGGAKPGGGAGSGSKGGGAGGGGGHKPGAAGGSGAGGDRMYLPPS